MNLAIVSNGVDHIPVYRCKISDFLRVGVDVILNLSNRSIMGLPNVHGRSNDGVNGMANANGNANAIRDN